MGKSRPMHSASFSAKDADAADQAAPRKFREHQRIMRLIESKKTAPSTSTPSASPSTRQKTTTNKPVKTSAAPSRSSVKIKDTELRENINRSARKTTKKFQKRKSYLDAWRAKKLGKRPPVAADNIDSDAHQHQQTSSSQSANGGPPRNDPDVIERRLRDTIRFGETVQAPPKLTVAPKARKLFVPKSLKHADNNNDDNDDDNSPQSQAAQWRSQKKLDKKSIVTPTPIPVSDKIGRKRKLKDLSQSEQIALLRTRDNAIASYRSAKASRMQIRDAKSTTNTD